MRKEKMLEKLVQELVEPVSIKRSTSILCYMLANKVGSPDRLQVTDEYLLKFLYSVCSDDFSTHSYTTGLRFTDADIEHVFGDRLDRDMKRVNAKLIQEGFYYFMIDDMLIPLAYLAHKGGSSVQCCCAGHYSMDSKRITGDEFYLWLVLPNSGSKDRLLRFLYNEVNKDKYQKNKFNRVTFDTTGSDNHPNSIAIRGAFKGYSLESPKTSVDFVLKDRFKLMDDLYCAITLVNNIIKSEAEGFNNK